MPKNKTRRNKSEGGKRRNKTEGGKRRNKTEGGKRKTRKLSKGASEWNKAVMKVYAEMKKKDSKISFGDALKETSRRKKAGEL